MKILKNIAYDIKAIRKYGLIRHIKYLFDYEHVIVNMQIHADFAPQYIESESFVIKEVDVNNEAVLEKWVEIVNDAFGFEAPYDVKSAKKYLSNHLYKNLVSLYFIYSKKENTPVGTYFIATFKNNRKIGTSGRLAVLRRYQGHGIGRQLVLYGLKKYKEIGINNIEEVAVTKRDYSVRLYFKCGAIPQFNRKYCQLKPTPKFFLVRLWAKIKVKKMYKEILKKRNEAFLKKASKK